MSKISTTCGELLDLENPQPSSIQAKDISIGLSRKTRWSGQINYTGFYSVAEHSLRVGDCAQKLCEGSGLNPTFVHLCGLMHDAHEAFLVDLPTPLKSHTFIFNRPWRELESRVQECIELALGYKPDQETLKIVQEADRRVLEWERRRIQKGQEWEMEGIEKTIDHLRPVGLWPTSAEGCFHSHLWCDLEDLNLLSSLSPFRLAPSPAKDISSRQTGL